MLASELQDLELLVINLLVFEDWLKSFDLLNSCSCCDWKRLFLDNLLFFNWVEDEVWEDALLLLL